MTVEEVYKYLEELINKGKGDYKLTCEGGCVLICAPGKVWDEFKEIEF